MDVVVHHGGELLRCRFGFSVAFCIFILTFYGIWIGKKKDRVNQRWLILSSPEGCTLKIREKEFGVRSSFWSPYVMESVLLWSLRWILWYFGVWSMEYEGKFPERVMLRYPELTR